MPSGECREEDHEKTRNGTRRVPITPRTSPPIVLYDRWMALDPTTSARSPRWSIAAFGVTILAGAFLLFQVQPLVSKAILPWFGGCPAVWTTCMLFFQVVLFAGYCYAHLLQRWLTPRRQAAVHLAVVVAGLALLPILPGA